MAKVSIHVWHDRNGQILAIGRAPSSAKSKRKVVPIAGRNQSVLETIVAENAIKSLHNTHRVDVERGVLVEVNHQS